MVLNAEKLKFKVILGHRYVTKIEDVLNEWNELDTSGKAYSKGMIRQVFNGYRENTTIEAAIVEAAKRQKKLEKNLKKEKLAILR